MRLQPFAECAIIDENVLEFKQNHYFVFQTLKLVLTTHCTQNAIACCHPISAINEFKQIKERVFLQFYSLLNVQQRHYSTSQLK